MKNLIYASGAQTPKNTGPVIKKTGMTATIKLGNEELQVVDHNLVLKQNKEIKDHEERIQELEEKVRQSNQAIRVLAQEIQKLKASSSNMFRK